jgi:uncharacterized protein DUF6894
MLTARYLRSQAELCLKTARHHLSDPHDANRLRAIAADYLARALEAERGSENLHYVPALMPSGAVMTRYYFRVDYDDTSYQDDIGEMFPGLNEAIAHAGVVARELRRNNPVRIAVSVVDETGATLADASTVEAARQV